MKSKTFFHKKFTYLFLILLISTGIVVSFFTIDFIEFEGDLTYLNYPESRLLGLNLLKNSNLFFRNEESFKSELRSLNPEIKNIFITPKKFAHINIKIENYEICCVLKDINNQKFLLSLEGKVIKKLDKDKNYLSEIALSQEIKNDSQFEPETIKKLVEIENILIAKNIELANVKIENKKIQLLTNENQEVIIDSETSVKSFFEKFETMLNYLKQKNLTFKKMDFRFGNVVIE